MQTIAKVGLRQSELGIKAGRLCLTWKFIHQMKEGTVLALMINSAMLDGLRMLVMSDDRMLSS